MKFFCSQLDIIWKDKTATFQKADSLLVETAQVPAGSPGTAPGNVRHQDHRLISDLAWNMLPRPSHPGIWSIPKYDGDLGQPNVFVPLEKEVCEEKAAALCRFFRETQSNKHRFSEDTFLALMRLRGVEVRLLAKYAKAFHGRKLTFGCAPKTNSKPARQDDPK